MRFSNRSRYALRASLALAKLGRDGSPISITYLSEQEEISSVFLEQIFFKLRKAGILSSVRGSGGGFYFSKPLEEITLKEILDATGEELDTIACNKQTKKCDRLSGCISHKVLSDATDILNNFLKNITLASILENYSFEEINAALNN
jgi:Rrf2 family iron-sulfur cluster assembly transcriptional regulator